MATVINRVVAGVATLAVITAAYLAVKVSHEEDAVLYGTTPPPARQWLTQNIDLRTIERIEPRSDTSVVVYADGGRPYTMDLTTPCPGLVQAKSISFFTDGSKNLDRFAGVLINGRACTFKDFHPGA
ncbi:MAG: hypothetical protein IPI06_11845 [Gammaproteobacteria bacterium]|nr:hypothetical protein [Gammaproteobacteria bacterium]